MLERPTDLSYARRPTIIFIHNMKTGGSTLRRLIHHQYERGLVLNLQQRHLQLSTIQELGRITASDQPPFRAIQGHVPFGLHELLSTPFTYVTLVRDPVDRIMSLYYNSVTRRTAKLRKDDESPTLERFALGRYRIWGRSEVDNAQTRRLSGMQAEFGACSREMLERAKANLAEHFSIVGVTERFDESLILMKRAFGWGRVLYHSRKVATDRPKRDSLSPAELALIQERNALDVELHEYAGCLLEGLLRRQGPDFEIEVQAFKQVNHEYQQGGGSGIDRGTGPVVVRTPGAEPSDALRAALARAYAEALRGRHHAEQRRSREIKLETRIEKLASGEAALRAEVAALQGEVGALREKLARARHRARQTRRSRTWRVRSRCERVRARLAALVRGVAARAR